MEPGGFGHAALMVAQPLDAVAPRRACPACLQRDLLYTLLAAGEAALQTRLRDVWPIDAAAAFGALPTPIRLRADPRYTGRGVTLAMIDSAFYPHPDLVEPANRIRAWVDATQDPVQAVYFGAQESPRWPGWDRRAPIPNQWHGLMTAAAAAGNGRLSDGLYRGLACDADLILVQAQDDRGRITNATLIRALHWLRRHGPALGLRIVNLSVGGDPVRHLAGNHVDREVALLAAEGIVVVAAAGNNGSRRLVPPATASAALTIGGIDDKNSLDREQVELWHSNYGETVDGAHKPDLLAPSIWVVAPILPGTELANQAAAWFARRAQGDTSVAEAIASSKLVTRQYQHVDGTSFAAALVSSAVACMLEVHPGLTPDQVRSLLIASAQPVRGAPPERQGAGALDAGLAVALARHARHGPFQGRSFGAHTFRGATTFLLHDPAATRVSVVGTWDGWRSPGMEARRVTRDLWLASRLLPPGRYGYKFLLGGTEWRHDPANPARIPDGYGGQNSLLHVPSAGIGSVRTRHRTPYARDSQVEIRGEHQ